MMYNIGNSNLPIRTGTGGTLTALVAQPLRDCTGESAMSTFVYFIGVISGPIKIGVSDNPQSRLNELQTAHYEELRLFCTIECETRNGAFALEAALHNYYAQYQVRAEWFKIAHLIRNDMMLLFAVLNLSLGTVSFHAELPIPLPTAIFETNKPEFSTYAVAPALYLKGDKS